MTALDNAKAVLARYDAIDSDDDPGYHERVDAAIDGLGVLRALIAEHERVLAMPHVRILFEGQEFDGTSLAVSGGENAGYWVEGPPTHIAIAEHERVLAERAAPQEWEYGVRHSVGDFPRRTLAEALEERGPVLNAQVIRRTRSVPAGPWEPLPEDTGQTADDVAFMETDAPLRCGKRIRGSVPAWAGSDQVDPCECILPDGHPGDCACSHTNQTEGENR